MEVIFLHPAIICKTTLHFRSTEPNYVMAGNATIDHLEHYQLGDLSGKIVALQAWFIALVCDNINMCKA